MGIYAYSYSSFLITAFLCVIPSNGLRWALIGYSAVTSTGFLMVTYWNDLKEKLSGQKRLVVIAFICVCQLVLLLIFKLYFFKHVTAAD